MMMTASTVTPGSMHKSQPTSRYSIMKNWVVSIGGGGVSHSRKGGPIAGGRQLVCIKWWTKTLQSGYSSSIPCRDSFICR